MKLFLLSRLRDTSILCVSILFIYLALFNVYIILPQPLHIAVKSGRIRLVKLIVEFTKSTILMLDVHGQTTLHAAVKLCYPQVTSILLAAADPRGLQMENTVGNTLFEMASLSELSSRIQRFSQNQVNSMSELEISGVSPFYRYPGVYIQKLQRDLPQIHAILDVLFADGTLKSQTKLATELTKFVSMMKERLSSAEAAHTARLARIPKEVKVSENKDPQDARDVEKTLSIVVGALKDSTVNRQLIHLIDVQKSVGVDLEKAGSRHPSGIWGWKDEGELEAERDEDKDEKAQSMVWQHISVYLLNRD